MQSGWCIERGVSKTIQPIQEVKPQDSSFVNSDSFPLRWDFGFWRNLNELEIAKMARLLDLLERVKTVPSTFDKRIWKLDHSGLISCHSFCSHIQNIGAGVVVFLHSNMEG